MTSKGLFPQWFLSGIFPIVDEEVLNQITCFQANGSQEGLADVQHTIPDINAFEVRIDPPARPIIVRV